MEMRKGVFLKLEIFVKVLSYLWKGWEPLYLANKVQPVTLLLALSALAKY